MEKKLKKLLNFQRITMEQAGYVRGWPIENKVKIKTAIKKDSVKKFLKEIGVDWEEFICALNVTCNIGYFKKR